MPSITIDATAISNGVRPVSPGEEQPRPHLSHNGPDTIEVPIGPLGFSVEHYAATPLVVQVGPDGAVTYDNSAAGYVCGTGTSTDPLVLQGFSVRIDASALSHGVFSAGAWENEIIGPGGAGELRLLPGGPYALQVASGVMSHLLFSVEPDGAITPGEGCDAFAHVDARGTLVLDGYEVTWDLRDLSHGVGSYIVGRQEGAPTMNYPLVAEAGEVVTFRMLPVFDLALAHAGSGVDCSVALDKDGRFSYAAAQQSYLDGAGTAYLRLLGHPLVVDARDSTVELVHFAELGMQPTSPNYLLASVLPFTNWCSVETTGADLGPAFRMRQDGSVEVQGVDGISVHTAPRVVVAPPGS